MKYVELDGFGDASVMHIKDMELPKPKRGQIRIKVAAAGVNRPDLMQRAGLYPAPKGASPVLGLECAGTVDKAGKGVKSLSKGDAVCALLAGGGYAEYVIVDARHVLPIPEGLDMIEAAGLPETCFTVWTNVFDRARLQLGEKLLVHGGTSGIGTTAIQMARAMGAEVFATAGSDEKCAAITRLGAQAINYKKTDFADYLRDTPIDVILDMVGGDYIAKNMKVLNTEGRLVNIAYQNGPKAEVNFLPVMLKRLSIMGSTLRPRSDEDKAEIAHNLRLNIWPIIGEGVIRPVIDRVFDLADVRAAHKYLEAGNHIGKVILRIS